MLLLLLNYISTCLVYKQDNCTYNVHNCTYNVHVKQTCCKWIFPFVGYETCVTCKYYNTLDCTKVNTLECTKVNTLDCTKVVFPINALISFSTSSVCLTYVEGCRLLC